MYFDKLIWNSVSPIRKDSTYISLEYVLNDLGVFCKGEQRTKDVGFAMSRIGAPLGLTAVENTDYAAKALGRVVILWSRITDVKDDTERGVVVVSGNANDKIVIQCDQSKKADILSFMDSMRQFCAASPESDETAAAWLAWAADKNLQNPFSPLDELIEAERTQLGSRSFTEAQLTAAAVSVAEDTPKEVTQAEEVAPAPVETPVEAPASICPACGAKPKPNAKFCTQCGVKL